VAVTPTDRRSPANAPNFTRVRRWRRWFPVVLGVVTVAILVAVVLRLIEHDDVDDAIGPSDPGIVHVHGIGVDPGDGQVYVATHQGLVRLPEDVSEPAIRVGGRYHDLMGFSVAGPDRFLAGGHPDGVDDELMAPNGDPMLGLVESVDGGRSWTPRSLFGEIDLHALAWSPTVTYGYDATNEQFLATTDLVSWEERSRIVLTGFAVDPLDAEHLVAVTADGALVESGDGARTWAPLDAPASAAVAWDGASLWSVGIDQVLRRSDAGRAWEDVQAFDRPVDAFTVVDDRVIVAIERYGVIASDDAGASWRVVYQDLAAPDIELPG
jgi:hypothetical protein